MTLPSYASGLLFTKAHGLVRQRIYDVLGAYKLNPTSWAVLGTVARASEGVRLSTVAESIGMTPPMITVVADELITLGLIKRIPHHTDGRAKLLVLTPEGRKQSGVIEQQLNQDIQRLLSGLQPGEIAAFRKTLETIIQNAQVE